MRYKLSLKDITSHEVEYTYHIQTKKGSSGVKRAIVGGILAGGVGAVVGGVTAGSDSESQKIIDSVSVKLEIDNLQFHTVYIPCISIEVARDVEGIIRVIRIETMQMLQSRDKSDSISAQNMGSISASPMLGLLAQNIF